MHAYMHARKDTRMQLQEGLLGRYREGSPSKRHADIKGAIVADTSRCHQIPKCGILCSVSGYNEDSFSDHLA